MAQGTSEVIYHASLVTELKLQRSKERTNSTVVLFPPGMHMCTYTNNNNNNCLNLIMF